VKERLTAYAGKCDVEDVWRRIRAERIDLDVWELKDLLEEPVLDGREMSRYSLQIFVKEPSGCAEAGDASDIFGSGPQLVFLVASPEGWSQSDSFADVEDSYPFGAMDLMCRQREQVYGHLARAERDFSPRLDGIDMEEHRGPLASTLADGPRDVLNRLDRSELVVDGHD